MCGAGRECTTFLPDIENFPPWCEKNCVLTTITAEQEARHSHIRVRKACRVYLDANTRFALRIRKRFDFIISSLLRE
ncbi:hypothetical protein EVAR_2216_1 [Eumeta japonica]|uniref:Uncharacterized protein n=1 Tax=Eumeta variegata TaxID=151549 RepID=A0A4C1SFU9_EUMVA|nr:hypothetical protein EVAR_2216_1 [Eumeta japonica]